MSASRKKIKDCSHCQKYLQEELGRVKDWETNRKRIIEEVANSAWDCPNYGGRHDMVDYRGIHHFRNCQNHDCYKCWTQCTECSKQFKSKDGRCKFCDHLNNVCVIPTSDGIISVSCDKCGTMVTSNNGFGDSNVNNHNCQIQQSQSSHSTQNKSISDNNQITGERERERERAMATPNLITYLGF